MSLKRVFVKDKQLTKYIYSTSTSIHMFDSTISNETVASSFLPPIHGKLKYLVQQQPHQHQHQHQILRQPHDMNVRSQKPFAPQDGPVSNSSCSPVSLGWKPNKFMQQYIIPKDSIFNRPSQGDSSVLVARALRRHDKLVRAVRPHKAPLQISPIEREASKILRGRNQEIAVTSGSFAKAIMEKMRDQNKRRKSITESLTSVGESNATLNTSSITAAIESLSVTRSRSSISGALAAPGNASGTEQQGPGHHRRRSRAVHDGITEEDEEDGSNSPVMQQFRKVARALGKTAMTPAFQKKLLPMAERFRQAAKCVCKAVRNSKVDGRIGLRDVMRQQQGRDEELELMSNESHVLSSEAMYIWYKDTQQRTSADLDYLERGIALIKCFNKYTASVRRELCRVAKFECFQEGRMLLKQGHDPISMYFIISGTVEVVKSETDLKTSKTYTQTVAVLHPGDGFGDVALMNRTKRTASAVCRSDVKLLRVDGEDYQEVIRMAVEQELLGKLEFLRSLNVFYDMEDMPELTRLAEIGILKEYQQNSVIHKDIVNSDDIYFIRKVFHLDKCNVWFDIYAGELSSGASD